MTTIQAYQQKQADDMLAKHPPGSTVKWNGYALRAARDYYLGIGQPQRRAQAKQHHDDKAAERMVVKSVEFNSQGYPYFVLTREDSIIQTSCCRIEAA